jgi:glucose-6-phosphate isomerase
VLHTALRDPHCVETQTVLLQMELCVEKIRAGTFTDIVNIGIGGPDLGPVLVTDALTSYQSEKLQCHFISNVDPEQINTLFKKLDPKMTLFIVSSKSFNTLETLTNAQIAKDWSGIKENFLAVTAEAERAITFGILPENIFTIWDWVGGRYSVWSAVGLPIAIMIGMDQFREFLAGAHSMDHHFQSTPFEKNMPVISALVGIWYINFWNAHTQAIIPYTNALQYLPAYLQQLDMESNGKSVRKDGTPVDYDTGPIIWGGVGCNSQHAFHQLLYQGTRFVPIDFIASRDKEFLLASCLSQAQALLQGKTEKESYKTISGNHPCNLLTCEQLTPFALGALLALYEHKVFVQGAIWGINSFDQWGVELGKQLLKANTHDTVSS